MSDLPQIAPPNVRRAVAALLVACGLLGGMTPGAAEADRKAKPKAKEQCLDSSYCGDGRRNG